MPTVLITGTSSGFGLATAIELGKRGWTVIATMRDLGRRGELDRAIAEAGLADRVKVEHLDVTSAQSIDLAISVLDLAHRPLDAVVHNAGVAAGGAFEDLGDADIRRVMEVNYFGVLALTRRLLPAFRAQRRGRIVIVSSESAFAGQPLNAPYCASKWAIEGWAESVAYEIEPFGIDIALVEPGPYRTNIWDASPRIMPETSPYRPLARYLSSAVDAYVAKAARDPLEVATSIARVLESRRPRFRTAVGPTAKFAHFARGKLPTRVMRRIFKRFFALDNVRW